MNAKVKTLVLVVFAVALISGLIMVLHILSPLMIVHTNPYDLTMKIQGHTWGTDNACIVLSVNNTTTKTMSVNEVRINSTVVNNVAYGGDFTGTTMHTLDPKETGTITITYPFSPRIKYVFQVGAHTGWLSVPYTATAP